MNSGWMGWAKNDKISSIDLKGLEELFGVDKDKAHKVTPGENSKASTVKDR